MENGFHRGLPRTVDVVVAAVLVVATAPLLLVAAALIRLTSRGPVVYRAPRVGLDGEEFEILKLRTMRPNSAGPQLTSRGDQRITSIGKLLRLTKIDELPQLFCVLKGDMALVGPRPEDPKYVKYYSPEHREVFAVRPGLTSLASVYFRHEEVLLEQASDPERTYIERILPEKLSLELKYLQGRTVSKDVRSLWLTLVSLGARRHGKPVKL